MADLTKTVKDAGYVLVGLGVIGFQRAQVRRHELTQQLEARTKDLEAQLADLRTRIEPVFDELQGRLPEPVADVVKQARVRIAGAA